VAEGSKSIQSQEGEGIIAEKNNALTRTVASFTLGTHQALDRGVCS
jgi:hypothetical protein